MLDNKPRMLTIDEAASLVYGLSKYRIRKMCIDGTLPHIKAGKKYLINQAYNIRRPVRALAIQF